MASRKRYREVYVESAEKENHPPKKAKQSVSISGLYKRHPLKKQDNETRDTRAPKPAGVTKIAARKNVFVRFAKPKKEHHPLYRDFKGQYPAS